MDLKHIIFIFTFNILSASSKKRVHLVHWEKSNPIFRIDKTDNVIDVNLGNTRWEYDQANFVCPRAKSGEKYIIYSVSKDEYDSCLINENNSKIVATCNGQNNLYFTITFRTFSPIPGGLEFEPGKDYYFITTSSEEDLQSKFGGRCATHNMKVMFKVAENARIQKTAEPRVIFEEDKNKYLVEKAKEVVKDFQKYQNEVVKQEASRMENIENSSNNLKIQFLYLVMLFSIWIL